MLFQYLALATVANAAIAEYQTAAAPAAASTFASAPTATPSATCPQACSAAYDSCRIATDANRAVCASTFATCLGYNPFGSDGSLVTPTACSSSAVPTTTATTDCPSECSTKYDSCRIAPNANRAVCASEYSTCLGYSPFGTDGSLITPTACSSEIATTASMTVNSTASYIPSGTGAGSVITPTAPGVPQFTGAADSVKPIMGLLALGALAFL